MCPIRERYSEKLLNKFDKYLNFEIVLFVNSGSEANDLALRVARKVSKGSEVVCINNSYHGMT